MGFELRDYQKSAVDGVLKSWLDFDRVLGVSPTGSGKTVIFADIADQRKDAGRVLILAHREEMIDQAIGKLQEARGLYATKEKAADRAALDADVVVGSVQTLSRQQRLERFPVNHFATIIVDEAHHVLADSYQKILGYFQGPKVFGTTATPDRGDTRNLGQYFEDVAFEIGLVDLIKAGHLSRIKVRTVPVTIDISDVSTRGGDYSEEEVAEALEPVLDELARAIATHARARKTLIFVPLIRIATQFSAILCRHNFAAEMICGTCSDRAEKLARFKTGETSVLVNAMLLNEGYDEPSVDCVVCLRPTKIRSLYAQMVGRGTRIYPGKADLLLLDFLWISRRHNLVRPAELISHDSREADQITKILAEPPESKSEGKEVELSEEPGDLVEALTVSQDRALADQILAQQKLKGEVHDLLDIIDLCVAFRAPQLEHYAPTMHWHTSGLTDQQRVCLSRARVDLSAVRDRGHASAIIDAMIKHNATVPATPKQLRYLYHLGYRGQTDNLSKPVAMRLIATLKAEEICAH
jgi:superfamily II DNA or RNA helicase